MKTRIMILLLAVTITLFILACAGGAPGGFEGPRPDPPTPVSMAL